MRSLSKPNPSLSVPVAGVDVDTPIPFPSFFYKNTGQYMRALVIWLNVPTPAPAPGRPA